MSNQPDPEVLRLAQKIKADMPNMDRRDLETILRTSLDALLMYSETVAESYATVDQLRASVAELESYKAEADALSADNQRLRMAHCDKTHAELRARLEDAELIAWGLARGERHQFHPAQHSPGNCIWFYQAENTWYMEGIKGRRELFALGSADFPALTPEAREALRAAKKKVGQ